jgi:hypothetical protein
VGEGGKSQASDLSPCPQASPNPSTRGEKGEGSSSGKFPSVGVIPLPCGEGLGERLREGEVKSSNFQIFESSNEFPGVGIFKFSNKGIG